MILPNRRVSPNYCRGLVLIVKHNLHEVPLSKDPGSKRTFPSFTPLVILRSLFSFSSLTLIFLLQFPHAKVLTYREVRFSLCLVSAWRRHQQTQTISPTPLSQSREANTLCRDIFKYKYMGFFYTNNATNLLSQFHTAIDYKSTTEQRTRCSTSCGFRKGNSNTSTGMELTRRGDMV
jgi:hypothetical protein